jgi:glucose-1-phosphate cytidylyltransferase
MKTVILAGGAGTRLAEMTNLIPKPLVEIGGRPVLWHIMKIYERAGFHEFCIALGYKGNLVKEYFLNYSRLNGDITVDLRNRSAAPHQHGNEKWVVHLMDTGIDAQTGGRLRRLRDTLGRDTFMMTYGDGVADIDVAEVLAFHRRHGKLATVTAVQPPARFGALRLDGSQVAEFVEKPAAGEAWINGGFFVLDPKVIDFVDSDDTAFEREPLERLAQAGQLMAFKHSGF